MNKRLEKRALSILEQLDVPRTDLIDAITHDFLGGGSRMLQDYFKKLNEQFFNNELVPCLIIHTYCTFSSDAGNFRPISLCGGVIEIKARNWTDMKMTLLHEMQHYYNLAHNQDQEDMKHGVKWGKSLQHILDVLNIKFDTCNLTQSEREGFPRVFFNNYGLYEHFSSTDYEPLPDGYEIKLQKVEAIKKENKEVICTGNAHADLNNLVGTFGTTYIDDITGWIKC